MELSDSLRWNIYILNITGFYPIDPNKNSKKKIMLYIIYSIFLQSLYIVLQLSQITYMIQHSDDPQMILKMLPKVLEQCQSTIQAGIFWKNSCRIRRLIETFKEPVWNKNNKYSVSLIKTIPLGSVLYSLQPLINGFLWLLYPYIDSKDEFKLPLDIWMPNNLNIHFVLLYEVVTATVAAIGQTMTHTLVCGLIAHANAQLKALRSCIENIGKSTIKNKGTVKRQTSKLKVKSYKVMAQEKFGTNKYDKKSIEFKTYTMKQELVKCIQHYELILRYVKELESIISWATFIRLASSAIIICSSIIPIVFANWRSIEFLFNIVFAFGMFMELGIFCYFGDNLIIESSRIFEAIYNCEWISTDTSFKRIILIFMIRTQKPMVIWAGKFFELSIQSFVNVLKTSYSYYAVLRSLKMK